MEIRDQSDIRAVLDSVTLPKVSLVRQIFPHDGIRDVPACLRGKLAASGLTERIQPGMRVVLTGSSRQIANMPAILRELASCVKARGGQPYIIPAMGSHGGATAEGQRAVLESYGITEEQCGCQIYSSMQTVQIGVTADGEPVRIDKFAHDADAIIIVARIKAHTAFRGPYESGLAKMMTVGLGKREGADLLHRLGFGMVGQRIPQFARVVFDNSNIIFGVAAIENEHDETCRIEVLPGEQILDREPELLRYAKTRQPCILLPETDVLAVRQIGKNFSGSGMDPNVTGTFTTPFATGGIRKQRVVVLDISAESHGNFAGLGAADITTKRAFEKLDTNATYFNMLTSTVLAGGKIPMVMETDKMALQAAVKTLTTGDSAHARLLFIRDTLSLDTIILSDTLLEQARQRTDMEILEPPRPLRFGSSGELLDLL